MPKTAPIPVDLPQQLIEQYKKSLVNITDTRLVILLAFSSFEEVMKAFAAWRLSCSIDDVPRFLTRSSNLLFQVVLIGKPGLLQRAKKFAELRNNVAHKFHLGEYETLLANFIVDGPSKSQPPNEAEERRFLIETVFGLALEIAEECLNLPDRAEFPYPMLSLELTAPQQ